VSFCCFREDRIEMVRGLAARVGFDEVPGRPGVWLTTDADLAAWIRANCYTGDQYRAPFKRVPEIVKVASVEQIRHFLTYFGDQHIGVQRQFYSSSRRLIDDLQGMLLQTGKRSGIYEQAARSATMKDGREIHAENCAHTQYVLSEWNGDQLSIERKRQIRRTDYKGAVYCATVPNGLLVTRRNNTILISGNSCTAHGTLGAFRYDLISRGKPDIALSRLQQYYNSRALEGTTKIDNGAEIRDALKAICASGACPESEWPYVVSKFATRAPAKCYTDAKKHEGLTYQRVSQSLASIKSALAGGLPVIIGISVYESFESDAVARTGTVPMPKKSEQLLGGHCVICVGFDDATQRFRCMNSWGTAWGKNGDFTLPYAYLTNTDLCSDLWVLSTVTG
jgi:hypothetical protein